MKIPDEVFEKRCPYCMHGKTENENQDVPEYLLFSAVGHRKISCNIFGIAKYNKIQGECLDFMPNHIYGICYTCEHCNVFHPGFCLRNEQPNKRKLYIGCGGFADATTYPDYWRDHILSTCDNYTVSAHWIDTIRKEATDGKIPRNFDPDTMKPIGTAEKNEIAERWAEIERKQLERKKAEEKAVKEKQRTVEQISLF